MKIVWTVLGIAAFVGLLALATMQEQQVECEVCIQSGGAVHLTLVQNIETALAGARSNACGTYTDGMDAEMQCRNAVPYSATCRP